MYEYNTKDANNFWEDFINSKIKGSRWILWKGKFVEDIKFNISSIL